jgi:hypothetical protein
VRGYGKATVSANIAELMKSGRKQKQAIAIAIHQARQAYRKKYPRGKFPHWLARMTNPVRPLSAGSEKSAIKLFENFTGMKGAVIEYVDVPELPRALAIIGELDFVGYTTVREGVTERYKHAFRKQSRPLLCVSHDGRSLYIVGGRYHFTERGIEDK